MGIAHRTTVFIPSHNEEDSLPTTLTSLLNRGFGRIVVVSDNSTDGTVQVARSFGVDVFETVGNTDKKAGALNQALSHYLPQMDESDFAFCIDADTSLGEDFMTVAQSTFEDDPALVAIGGVFKGEAPTNPLELAQFNEYARYGREVERTKRTMVLSGTSSLMKVWILREIAKARGTLIPGTVGDYYDQKALTEDNELTLAIKTLGYRVASPEECSVTTELMPTIRTLHNQRVRWYRGALENLYTYGLTKVTLRYWFQQFMLVWGSLMIALLLVVTPSSVLMFGFQTSTFWLIITLIFLVERTVTVWNRTTWQGRVMAILIIPELIYCILLYGAFLHGAALSITKVESQWHHVQKEDTNVQRISA